MNNSNVCFECEKYSFFVCILRPPLGKKDCTYIADRRVAASAQPKKHTPKQYGITYDKGLRGWIFTRIYGVVLRCVCATRYVDRWRRYDDLIKANHRYAMWQRPSCVTLRPNEDLTEESVSLMHAYGRGALGLIRGCVRFAYCVIYCVGIFLVSPDVDFNNPRTRIQILIALLASLSAKYKIVR